MVANIRKGPGRVNILQVVTMPFWVCVSVAKSCSHHTPRSPSPLSVGTFFAHRRLILLFHSHHPKDLDGLSFTDTWTDKLKHTNDFIHHPARRALSPSLAESCLVVQQQCAVGQASAAVLFAQSARVATGKGRLLNGRIQEMICFWLCHGTIFAKASAVGGYQNRGTTSGTRLH